MEVEKYPKVVPLAPEAQKERFLAIDSELVAGFEPVYAKR